MDELHDVIKVASTTKLLLADIPLFLSLSLIHYYSNVPGADNEAMVRDERGNAAISKGE